MNSGGCNCLPVRGPSWKNLDFWSDAGSEGGYGGLGVSRPMVTRSPAAALDIRLNFGITSIQDRKFMTNFTVEADRDR